MDGTCSTNGKNYEYLKKSLVGKTEGLKMITNLSECV